MCGFAGFLSSETCSAPQMQQILTAMADRIQRRGPDDFALWSAPQHGLGMAFRRLAIVDLSLAGRQPMVSVSGRYHITFNGEIYNHKDLRAELEASGRAFAWRGHSDTETLLAAVEVWGLRATLERCVGMFALALWDEQTASISLAVDRLGEKPLYYGWVGDALVYGSELAVFHDYPGFAGEIDRGALSLLLRQSYIPAPYSIYQGVRKVEPGTMLTLSLAQRDSVAEAYWRFEDVAVSSAQQGFSGTPEQAIEELETLLKQAIKGQMEADVPLGAFLSGGIDSSTIVALMQELSDKPIKTFTIGFNESGFDEAVHAKDVAAHLKTEHTELYVSPQQALDVIPKLPLYYSEPFADSSQIPTFLVSQMARQKVTVSLSGDAGDEIFAGYNRYAYSQRLYHRLARIPRGVRAGVARGLLSLSPARWDAIARHLPGLNRLRTFGDKVHKGARVLAAGSIDEIYRGLVSQNDEAESWVIGGKVLATRVSQFAADLPGLGPVERMMVLDSVSYLPGDILVKLDRAAMSASLEGRIPFLDHRVVAFAWRLPFDLKLRGGVTKWILREILAKRVPRALFERPKSGFGIPLDAWLRGPLRGWAERLLDEERLKREGYLNAGLVRAAWTVHLSGAQNRGHQLWPVLMFQAWLEQYHGARSAG